MHTIRYYFRLIKAFISRFKFLIVAGIALGLLFSFIFIVFLSKLTTTHIERVGVTGKYLPNELPSQILALISDGLTSIDASGKPIPALATSWEAKDNGKTWLFHLTTDKKWSDGSRVTSSTLHYEFSDVEVSTPDETTIEFKLKTPFSPFPIVVSRPTFKQGLVGTGSWMVSQVSLAGNFVQKLTLKNKDGDQKIFKFYPSDDAMKLGFKLGEIDYMDELIDPTPFDTWPNIQVSSVDSQKRLISIFFNTEDSLLSSKPLRQALNYALDKDTFDLTRALSPLSPESWAFNAQVKEYGYDKARAKDLIKELPDEMKTNLTIKLVTYPALLPLAEKIAKQWQEVGVKTDLQTTSVQPSDFQAFLVIYDIPLDPDQYSLWHSTQDATNISNYKNPRIDKLLEDGRSVIAADERKRIYLDFQRFIVEDTPAIFLFFPRYYTVARTN